MGLISNLKQNDTLASIYKIYKRIVIKYYYGLHQVSPTFNFGGKCKISQDLKAGDYSYIGNNCLIYPNVSIGKYSMLAQNVQIIGDDHQFNVPGSPIIFSGRPHLKETSIGRDVWIGANCIILTGVTVGDGSIIAAGSVVTKDIPAMVIAGGVPAKVIKKRFQSNDEEKLHLHMLNQKSFSGPRNKPLQ
jgi:acetyltransferase-like isoleucine patch superfamily enzyme